MLTAALVAVADLLAGCSHSRGLAASGPTRDTPSPGMARLPAVHAAEGSVVRIVATGCNPEQQSEISGWVAPGHRVVASANYLAGARSGSTSTTPGVRRSLRAWSNSTRASTWWSCVSPDCQPSLSLWRVTHTRTGHSSAGAGLPRRYVPDLRRVGRRNSSRHHARCIREPSDTGDRGVHRRRSIQVRRRPPARCPGEGDGDGHRFPLSSGVRAARCPPRCWRRHSGIAVGPQPASVRDSRRLAQIGEA